MSLNTGLQLSGADAVLYEDILEGLVWVSTITCNQPSNFQFVCETAVVFQITIWNSLHNIKYLAGTSAVILVATG